jgi:hypothetical protein
MIHQTRTIFFYKELNMSFSLHKHLSSPTNENTQRFFGPAHSEHLKQTFDEYPEDKILGCMQINIKLIFADFKRSHAIPTPITTRT